jgi:ATP-dependent DNA helicase RecQ
MGVDRRLAENRSLRERLEVLLADGRRSLTGDRTCRSSRCRSADSRNASRRRPRTLAELANVPGIGPAKLERYGEPFLALLRRH